MGRTHFLILDISNRKGNPSANNSDYSIPIDILYPLIRHRALTMDQLFKIGQERRSHSTIYKYVNSLLRMRIISCVFRPGSSARTICATYPLVSPKKLRADSWRASNLDGLDFIRAQELTHILACTEMLIALTFLENVSGIASEHELDKSDFTAFCKNRRPDGIVQLTNSHGCYEAALEVETSPKNVPRMDRLIANYLETFQNPAFQCDGTLIVASTPKIYRSYERALANVPKEFQSRFVLLNNLSTKELNPNIWGALRSTPGKSAEKTRKNSFRGPTYCPIKSTRGDLFKNTYSPRYMDRDTRNENSEETAPQDL